MSTLGERIQICRTCPFEYEGCLPPSEKRQSLCGASGTDATKWVPITPAFMDSVCPKGKWTVPSRAPQTIVPCAVRGKDKIGERKCSTCSSAARLSVFTCPQHPEGVTAVDCRKCPTPVKPAQ